MSRRTSKKLSNHSGRVRRSFDLEGVSPANVFNDLLPDLKENSDDFAWACCPFHDDNNPSLCVNLASGWYKCHSTSCGATGSDIVGFVGALLACDFREAREYLEEHYG